MADQGGLRAFQGAVAIVTGGASGIGFALARTMASRGAEVILADRQGELAERAAESIRAASGRATAYEMDVTDPRAFQSAVDATVTRLGRLDYLFNNAGIGVGGEVRRHGLDDWTAILDVNLRGVIHGIQAAYPVMIGQGFGHIISTASVAAFVATPYLAAYGATKSAVLSLSKALRIEAEPHRVRVSALCPGVIRTPLLGGGVYGRLIDAPPKEVIAAVWERLRPMDADRFAQLVLRGVERNQAVIVVPGWWRLVGWLLGLCTSLELTVGRYGYRDLQRRIEAARKAAPGPDSAPPPPPR